MFRMLGRLVLGAVAFAALGVGTWNLATRPDSPTRPTLRRASFPKPGKPDTAEFLRNFRVTGKSPEYCAVRVQLPSTDGSLVPVWVDVVAVEGDVLEGVVSSSDVRLCGRKLGDPIRVRASEADDWMVIERGRVLGAMSLAGN